LSDPVFPGVHALLTLIRTLYRRPRFFERDKELEVRGDLPLPLVCLLGEQGADGFLARLDKELDVELAQVPHVRIDVAEQHEHADAVLPLLHVLHDRLRQRQFGREGSLKRFDNYELAHHLTGKELPTRQAKHDEPIRKVLRAWGLGSRVSSEATERADRAGGRVQAVVGVLKLTGYLIGLYWGRDRVPGLFRERRWFMRQPYMVPKHSPGVLRFAERLTKNRRSAENPDQVHKLLVHAFLEDLRIAYRRARLRVLPRRRGWRRTAYVTVLLDNIDEPGGWELLRLINEVRNETGELDPLLIIAAGSGTPPGLSPESRGDNEPTMAEGALTAWKDRLPRRRQLLAADARYLFVTLPRPGQPTTDPRDVDAWQVRSDDGPRPAPRLARHGVGELVTVAVLLAALTPTSLTVADYWGADCAFVRAMAAGVATDVVEVGGHPQCVGYSDNDDQVFGRNERLRHAQRAVFAQNAVAERLHRQVPERPYVSLIYFAGLTSNESVPATEHSVAEELEGVLIRQREQNTEESRVEPLLRVVVANGGTGMRAADMVARDMLVPLVESDPSILGVVGFDRSVAETEEAIAEFGRHGIPVLGTTLTSVGLGDLSPLYFQLVPDNVKQAELLSRYAREADATRVTVYHPPVNGPNTYVNTLVEVMRAQLTGDGVAVDDVAWRHSANELTPLCDGGTDRRDEIAYYAGREEDFGDFLRTVRRNCARPEMLPRIVADDAVSRFVAHAPGRRPNEFNGVTISYVGMGGLVVLAGRDCVSGKPGLLRGGGPALDAFCAGYRDLRAELDRLPPDERPIASWPGERVGGLYDAAGMFIDAVRRTGSPTPHRAAVALTFREMTFQGATGEISFRESRVGNDRNLTILTIANLHDVEGPDGVPVCALMIGTLHSPEQPRRSNGCPVAG
jgi:hypothetical protein